MAPRPDRNLIQVSSVPRTAAPITAPMMSWAIVPTTISDSAVETRSQIESEGRDQGESQPQAAKAQISVMVVLPPGSRPRRVGQAACAQQQKTRLAAGSRT